MRFVAFDLDTIKLLMNIFVRDLIVPGSCPVSCLISVVCIQDTDRSGTIGFNEVSDHDLFLSFSEYLIHPQFAGLWKYIKVCAVCHPALAWVFLKKRSQDWQGVFLHFDRDRSGTIDGRELEQALNQFGFRLTPQLLALLQRKYGASRESISYYHCSCTQLRCKRVWFRGCASERLPCCCTARNHV